MRTVDHGAASRSRVRHRPLGTPDCLHGPLSLPPKRSANAPYTVRGARGFCDSPLLGRAVGEGDPLLLSPLPASQACNLVVELTPDPLRLPPKPLVVAAFIGLGLALKLPEMLQALGGKAACLHRLLHRAAWFGVVATIPEAAAHAERRDLSEHLIEVGVVEELELTHARCVEENASSGQEDQFPMGREVAPATGTSA